MAKFQIPAITKERAALYPSKIRRVVQFPQNAKGEKTRSEQGDLYYTENTDPKTQTSRCWDPRIDQPIQGLEEFTRIKTLHPHSSHGYFMPFIVETLAQIPDNLIDDVLAFETLTDHIELTKDGKYHIAETVLYRKQVN